MIPNLIYDVGMYNGEDTKYYLRKGFSVIAVEANPALVAQVKQQLKSYIHSQQLTIVNVGIAAVEGNMTFYRNDHELEWSSFDKEIGTRNNTPFTEMQVPCRTISSLFSEFGVPYYLKIDIEGYDAICIDGLDAAYDIPPYVSCEASSIACLDALIAKGYTQFKLINQARNFAAYNWDTENNFIRNYFQHKWNRTKLRLQKIFPFEHKFGTTGPFAEDTSGSWMDANFIRKAYKQFYALPNNQPINSLSWFDIHAKK